MPLVHALFTYPARPTHPFMSVPAVMRATQPTEAAAQVTTGGVPGCAAGAIVIT